MIMHAANLTDCDKFRKVVRYTNIMTPKSEGIFRIKNLICEVTSGRGFVNEPIFGVTVVADLEPSPRHVHSLGKLKYSLDAAKRYIETLADVSIAQLNTSPEECCNE